LDSADKVPLHMAVRSSLYSLLGLYSVMGELAEETKSMVKGLLNKLAEMREAFTWRINNTYSDGINNTVLEILTFEKGIQTGRIAFQLEDGHVINYRYKELEKQLPAQIIDLLLDVIGLEMAAV